MSSVQHSKAVTPNEKDVLCPNLSKVGIVFISLVCHLLKGTSDSTEFFISFTRDYYYRRVNSFDKGNTIRFSFVLLGELNEDSCR